MGYCNPRSTEEHVEQFHMIQNAHSFMVALCLPSHANFLWFLIFQLIVLDDTWLFVPL